MGSSVKHGRVLSFVVTRVLTPLVRVLLRNGMSFNAFSDIAKRVFVEVGMREFGIPGRKQTASRVSILSGLSRKEVQRLVGDQAQAAGTDVQETYNRAARVIAGWVRDKDFTDAAGNPLELMQVGANAS
ncbi:MAG: DUF6502 family protein, partial [Burkholderiales bacterium]